MSLVRCQHDARLRTLDTTVEACTPAGEGRWAVRLTDTVLYPEGGGQPADHGTIGGVAVLDVQRGPDGVVHTTGAPVPTGPATVAVDWPRRFDHMQQHTAQHLITALAHDTLGRPTVAFHLGADGCTLDLAGAPLSPAELRQLQDRTNAEIRAARPVSPRVVDAETYAGLEVRSRGLPDGHDGEIRLVEIAGLDRNTCGGTHVSSTAALQVVVLTRAERVKGGCRVHYLAGGRVTDALLERLERERELTERLTAPPAEHGALVARLLSDAKARAKEIGTLQRELAIHVGRALAGDPAAPPHLHRPGADLGVLRAIADAALAVRPDRALLLTGEGVFLVAGPPGVVDVAGPRVAAALGGRGGGRGGRFQGKAGDLSAAPAAALALLGGPGPRQPGSERLQRP
jgi:Ser-tRNA(Ala) deacylase AlaX